MSGWRGRYRPGDAGWLEALDEALDAGDPYRSPARLAEMTVRFDATVFITESIPEAPDLPPGRPGRSVRRRIAGELLQLADGAPPGPSTVAWRVLGLLFRTANPRRDPAAEPGRDPEVLQRLQDVRAAADEAAALGDPLLQAIALLHRSSVERDVLDLPASRASAEAAVDILGRDAAHHEAAGPFFTALNRPSWLDPDAFPVRVRCAAHVRASITYQMLRDYPNSARQRQLATDEARKLVGSAPPLYASCLWRQSEAARATGDIRAMRSYLDDLQSLAQRLPGNEGVRREVLRASYYSYASAGDWDAAVGARLDRAASWIRSFAGGNGGRPTPAVALAAVEEFHRHSRAPALTGIGNDAYEVAKSLISSGRARSNPTDAAAARDWLDVASAAWEGVGLNGLHAVAFRRLELDAIAGRRTPEDVGPVMVASSRGWRRVEGQRTAACKAAIYGAPGDPVVLERLRELRAGAPEVDAAYLDLGIAAWHLRRGDALQSTDPAEAARAWEHACSAAASAEQGLIALQPSGRALLLNPEWHLEALQLQARALQRLRAAGSPDRVDPREELAVRARSLPSVAQRLVSALTPQQRAAVGRDTEQWLSETVELAARAQDAATADMAMEVVRRDRVGAILGAMSTDPAVPQQISELAGLLADALSVSIGGDSDTDGDPAEQEPDESATRAAALSEQIETALDLTEEVIGPLARDLFDPAAVQQPTPGVLHALHPKGPAAVLSLWLANSHSGPRLTRRLTHRSGTGQGIEQYLDVIDAPPWLPTLSLDAGPDLFFARLQRLTEVLLPPPLLELLAAADPEHPIPLTVIPTGLLGVPFAALPVDDRHLVLDLAVITTVQSLRTAVVLAGSTSGGSPEPGAFGIYDMQGLRYAAAEWDDLARHYPPGRQLRTLQDLQSAFGSGGPLAGALLAIALHGLPGPGGWDQAKRLPDGQALTPGHVLRWNVPPLVVGASCFTDIRAAADGELAGFPIAFQLRGAATVIGTLHEVHDRATAEIMGLFYAAAAAGFAPAAALRSAQRTWIAKDRLERLPAAEHWALLIAYGIR